MDIRGHALMEVGEMVGKVSFFRSYFIYFTFFFFIFFFMFFFFGLCFVLFILCLFIYFLFYYADICIVGLEYFRK